jgi:hypothetical protein
MATECQQLLLMHRSRLEKKPVELCSSGHRSIGRELIYNTQVNVSSLNKRKDASYDALFSACARKFVTSTIR